MSKLNEYVFVLWGDQFEEAIAAVFITGLRRAGLPVKVVGLNAQRLKGANGLSLLPDLTLGQALPLAGRCQGVIIPYAAADFERLLNDPRLADFFKQACSNGAKFVTSQANKVTLMALDFLPADRTLVYPDSAALLDSVLELAPACFGFVSGDRVVG